MLNNSMLALDEKQVEATSEAHSFPVFVVGPKDDKSYPGLIIVHEIFGLDEHIKDVARRFASTGMRVFAPELFVEADKLGFDRQDMNSMRKFWASIPDSRIISDLRAVFNYACLQENVMRDKVGTIGYCMGGAIAFMFACESKEIAFVCDYYGRVKYPELSENKSKHPIDYAYGLSCPVLGIFAGHDPVISAEDVALFEDQLTKLRKEVFIKVYDDAEHAFFNDRRPHYSKEAAEDAWARTLEFIGKQVGEYDKSLSGR